MIDNKDTTEREVTPTTTGGTVTIYCQSKDREKFERIFRKRRTAINIIEVTQEELNAFKMQKEHLKDAKEEAND